MSSGDIGLIGASTRAPHKEKDRMKPRLSSRRKRITLVVVLGLLVIIGTSAGVVYRKVIMLRRFHEMIPGQLYHSRQPENDFQYGVLSEYGIKRVINLRLKVENPEVFEDEKRRCEGAGIEFINIPVGDVFLTDEQIMTFLAAIRFRPGPTLFHCEHGRNRTLFAKAAYRIIVEDWPVDAAVAEMETDGAAMGGGKREKETAILKRLKCNRESWLGKVNALHPAPSGATVKTQ